MSSTSMSLSLSKGSLGWQGSSWRFFCCICFLGYIGTTVITQSQQQREICCFWAMFQVSWVQNDHSYRPGFVMGFFCFSKSMRLLEPKWLVFWFSKGLFFKGCLRVPGCALHQGSIQPKSQVSPEGTWKLRLRTRISQSDSFSLLRKANLPRLKHPRKSEVERIGEAKQIVVGLFPLAPLPTGSLHVWDFLVGVSD